MSDDIDRIDAARREGWDAALAAVRDLVGDDGLIDQHRLLRIRYDG